METKHLFFIISVAAVSRFHASMSQIFCFRESSIAKKTANKANPSVGRLFNGDEAEDGMSRDLGLFPPPASRGVISIKCRLRP